jgi:hypothetical protein
MYHTETIHATAVPKSLPKREKVPPTSAPGHSVRGEPRRASRVSTRCSGATTTTMSVPCECARFPIHPRRTVSPGSLVFHRRRVDCSRRAKLIRDRPARAPLTHPSPLPETQPAARRRGGRRRRDDSQAPVQGEQRRRLQPGTSRACLSSDSAIVVLCRPVEPTNLSRLQRKKNPPL